jgi:predicted double-glycine peptidase
MDNFRLLTRTRQSTEYSCGASALQAVLSYWGRQVDETDLIKLMHTNSEVGTYPEDIVRGARSLGFDAEMKDHLTLDEVQRFTAGGDPVIALSQVWRSHKQGASSVADEWDSGHYIVVLGVDEDYVYFQDPYVRMSKAFVPRKSFEDHWHQIMGGISTGNPKLIHVGIFVRGKKPGKKKRSSVGRKSSKPDFRKLGSLNLISMQFRGMLLPYDLMSELMPIWQSGDVRPDAFILLRKDRNGNLSGMEGGRLHDEDDMRAVNAVISALAGRGRKSVASRRGRVERAIDAVSEGDFGLSAGEIRKIANKLPPNHSAIALLVENVWERKLKEAAKKYAGTVVDQRLVTPEAVANAASKLAAAR